MRHRSRIILPAVATAMAMALPATAKQPVKPVPEPEPAATYTAEIVMLGTSGVATTCGGAIEVTRTDARGGAVTHYESTGAELEIRATDLAFGDDVIDGCHGTFVPPDDEGRMSPPFPPEYFEYFRITLDGDQVAMLWIFDVTFDENGEYRKDFRMGGPYQDVTNPKNGKITTDFATWTSCDPDTNEDEDGAICFVAAGTFTFVRYEAGGDPMFTDLDNGSQDFTLEITLDPND
jgi:hypothetical protein